MSDTNMKKMKIWTAEKVKNKRIGVGSFEMAIGGGQCKSTNKLEEALVEE